MHKGGGRGGCARFEDAQRRREGGVLAVISCALQGRMRGGGQGKERAPPSSAPSGVWGVLWWVQG
eukprot:365783-Chlamydomonas_euryale.AAC.7